jgi:hypothetical protein
MIQKKHMAIMYSYGWRICEKGQQKYGSPADIYLENDTYFMIIDDGNCVGNNHLFHIYNIDLTMKVFEGRLRDSTDFETLMRFLGF